MVSYHYQKLCSETNSNRELMAEVTSGAHYQGRLWGAFTGLFGMAMNEVVVVSSLDGGQRAEVSSSARDSELWLPTVRPLSAEPCTAEGLYVLRRFHVQARDVDEVVALSKEAWTTFEVSDSYAAQPQGLFRPEPDKGGIVRLMLVTWYDGFNSWELSRHPADAAMENFQRRRELTLSTYAVATRLVTNSPVASGEEFKQNSAGLFGVLG